MVKLVYMQTVFKMSRESHFMARHNGQLQQYQTRLADEVERAQNELNALLEDGFTILSSHMTDSTEGDYLTFVLYKPDALVTLDAAWKGQGRNE